MRAKDIIQPLGGTRSIAILLSRYCSLMEFTHNFGLDSAGWHMGQWGYSLFPEWMCLWINRIRKLWKSARLGRENDYLRGIRMDIKEVKNDPCLMTREAFEIYKQCMYRAIFSEYAEEIKRITGDPDCRVFACVDSVKYSGIIVLGLAADDAAEIVGIAVEKSAQRNGIGKFMILSAARKLHLKTLTAETDEEAVGFYERAGFSVKPFIRHFSDGDVLRYQCRLEFSDTEREGGGK